MRGNAMEREKTYLYYTPRFVVTGFMFTRALIFDVLCRGIDRLILSGMHEYVMLVFCLKEKWMELHTWAEQWKERKEFFKEWTTL